MDGLHATQQALVTVIGDFTAALREIPAASWTWGMAQSRMELLQGYWLDFQSNHRALIATNDDLGEDYDPRRVYTDIEQQYVTAQSLLYDTQRRLEPPAPGGTPGDHGSRDGLAPGVGHQHLPRMDVPTFSGRREDWESFRDLFRALIHDDPRLSDVARFYYLKSHVQGEAKAALDTLKLTNSNYASAWRLLESRYEHRRLLVQDHLTALRNLRPLREETSTGLQTLLDTLTRHRDQLQILKRPVSEWDDWFISIAASCMDPTTRRAWESDLEKMNAAPFDVTRPDAESTQIDEPMATYSMLTEFLQRRCHMISSVESAVPSRSSSSHTSGHATGRRARSYATRASGTCPQCHEEAHYIGHCQQFLELQPAARRNVALRARLCFNCLRTGHSARACLSKSVCQTCQALHHTLLHSDDRKRAADGSSAEVPAKRPKQAPSNVISESTGAEPPSPPSF